MSFWRILGFFTLILLGICVWIAPVLVVYGLVWGLDNHAPWWAVVPFLAYGIVTLSAVVWLLERHDS